VSILPLGLGPDLKLLSRIAPGILWIALLLSGLLSVDRIFHNDYEDGALEVLVTGPLPLELVSAAKALAHWLTTGIPLVLAAPVLALLLNLPTEAYGLLMLTMLTGSPAISFLGALGAALTLGLRRGGPLLPLLILPLYVPILVFGVSAINAVITGPAPFLPSYLILCALCLATLALAPFAAAAALRLAIQ
ncbi:MAG: heme exporter protein CcmB, partial [Alphaproteobacteria bacterium]